jgi:hypothetical protein
MWIKLKRKYKIYEEKKQKMGNRKNEGGLSRDTRKSNKKLKKSKKSDNKK